MNLNTAGSAAESLLSDYLERLADVRVLVAGDAMLDRYWFGDVQRISPEAPVPVVAVSENDERAGGAANVACNIAALGAGCNLIAIVGEDDAADRLEALLNKRNVETDFIRDADHVTTVKLRVISRNQQLLRADFEQEPDHGYLARKLECFGKRLQQADVLLLSDYGKGALKDIGDMIRAAREKGIPVLVDPKGRDFTPYRGASLITPNRHEFEDVVGHCTDLDDIAAKAAALIRDIEVDYLLITLSEKGMALCDSSGLVYHQPARAREVFDVSGAGDTVIGTMAAMLGAGADYRSAVHVANAAASIVVGKLGTATVTAAEIQQEINSEGSV